jgi:hypothetical protein
MEKGTTSDIWRSVALFLAGVVITMIGFQITQLRGTVTRTEVEAIVETQGPYSRERGTIATKLETINETQKTQSLQLKELSEQMQRVGIAVGATERRRSQ